MSTKKFCDLCDEPAIRDIRTLDWLETLLYQPTLGGDRMLIRIVCEAVSRDGEKRGEPLDICHACLARCLDGMLGRPQLEPTAQEKRFDAQMAEVFKVNPCAKMMDDPFSVKLPT